MSTLCINVSKARDNFSEILGEVRFGNKVVTIEKQGKPYAIVISPQEYTRIKDAAKKTFATAVEDIHSRNNEVPEDAVEADVSKVIQDLR